MVAFTHLTPNTGGWLLLTAEELRQQHEADDSLTRVRRSFESGQHPEWAEVSALGPEVKAYHTQWGNFEVHNGVIYRRWQAPGRGTNLLQLLVPQALCVQVLQVVHGSVGVGHYGNTKAGNRYVICSWLWITSQSGLRHMQCQIKVQPSWRKSWWRRCSPDLGSLLSSAEL